MLGFDEITGSPTAAEAALRLDSVVVRYKPSGVRNTRLIKVVKAALDPLQPPKHRYRKIPRVGGGSPPPVVMHSPPRPPTVEDLKNWRIPPCVSKWKNPKGYAIPLDKRHAAVGWGFEINHRGMAELSEALHAAQEVCREGVALRGKIRREKEMREKERREEELRELARRTRGEFGGKKRRSGGGGGEGRKKEKKKRRGGEIAASASGGFGGSARGELLFDRSLVDAYYYGGGDEDEVKTMMMKGGERERPIEFEREEDADPFGLDGFLSKLA